MIARRRAFRRDHGVAVLAGGSHGREHRRDHSPQERRKDPPARIRPLSGLAHGPPAKGRPGHRPQLASATADESLICRGGCSVVAASVSFAIMSGELSVGDVAGRYRITGIVGRGGVGITYAAEPLDGGAPVALKELRLEQADAWKTVELFEREARVLANIQHAAIPAYVDHFTVEGDSGRIFYLAQQLVPGRSLGDMVANGWRADEPRARRIAEDVLGALQYLHALRPPVYHRDITPMNLVLGPEGKVWLVDFGAVRDIYRSTASGGSSVAGTFGYMAPEQLRGVARPESDLYGLASTLLHILSGRAPADMPQRKLKPEFRPFVRVSPALVAWLDKAIEPVPEDRFPSVARALDALRARSTAVGARPLRRTTIALGAILIVLAGGLGAMGWVQRSARVAKMASGSAPRLPERPNHFVFPAVKYQRSVAVSVGGVASASFTLPGAQMVAGSQDDTAGLWDVATSKPLHAFTGHTAPVVTALAMPDGRTALTAGDRTLRMWTLSDGKLVSTIDADPEQVFAAAVAATGKTIASGGTGGQAKLWSVDGTLQRGLAHGGSRVLAVAFSADGARLATGGDDATIRVWNVADGSLQCMLKGHTAAVRRVAISPDGETLASASDDHSVRLWHMQRCAPVATLAYHTDEVWTVAFSPDGATVVSGGKDDLVGIWSWPSHKLRYRLSLSHEGRGTRDIAFSPDGLTLATAHVNGEIWLWHFARGGEHVVPAPVLQERHVPPGASEEQRVYSEAMDLMETGEDDDTRQLDLAEARLQRLLDAYPRSALALAGLARVAYKREDERDRAKALELADRALAANPSLADAVLVRAWTLQAQGDVNGARAALREANRLDPKSARAALLSGRLALDGKDYEEAERALRDALARPINRRNATTAFSFLADAYEGLNDTEAADLAHRRQIELDPDSAWAKGAYAGFLINSGDWDGAVAMAQKSLAQMRYPAGERELANAYCGQAACLLWDHDDAVDLAERTFRKALETDPTAPCAAYGLGAYHQLVGTSRHDVEQLAQARSWYVKAAALDPKNEHVRKALAALN